MSWNERRKQNNADLNIFKTTVTINLVPSTNAVTTVTFTGLASIDTILNVRITVTNPVVANVNQPQYGANAAGTAVGLTLSAGTGTTISAEVVVLGQ